MDRLAWKGLFALLVVTALLAGCATQAQRQFQAIRTNNQSAAQALTACLAAANASTDLAPIEAHMPLDITKATLQQLSDTSLMSDREKQSMLELHPKLQACREAFVNQVSQTTPSIAAIYAALYTKSEGSLIDLLQRKQSWGDHLRRVNGYIADARIQITQEEQRIVAGLNRSNEAELARRQAATNAMMQYYETQQIINSMNRPVLTNCTGANTLVGTQINCVSH